MQFIFVALLAVFAASVCAAPLNPLFDRATCDIKTCVVALQPSFPTACDPAALQLGANTQLNTACLVAAAKGTAAFPTACAPCATQFGVTDPGKKSQTATNGGTGNAAPANGGQGTVATGNAAPANGATANAAPANGGQGTAVTPAANKNDQAVGPRATCDIKACVITLEPSFPLCAPAVTQLGANNLFNTACLAAAAKGTAAFPPACDGCAAQFGVTDPGVSAKAAGVAIN
ncbi:hypothetical protein MVEN_01293200 [Mycena venus]|uniref:Fungal calcium binding protein domain-containing protein n=1 Tax=Mycena venus TaxID=2733690 RepID=A0A8H6Y1A2_9AGAR|nr:hypothetical protein MVEN_01293200 [Mycena venus]